MAREHAFFAMADRSRYIQRWSLMRNAQQENIAEHSFQTAVIAHGLAVIRRVRFPDLTPQIDERDVLLKALYHDVSEVITGDMPTPVKYQDPELKDAYKRIEQLASEDLLSMLPEDLAPSFREALLEAGEDADPYQQTVQKLVKAADRISAYLKCQVEISQGNLEFREAAATTLAKVQDMHMPEADVFLEDFAPPFSLSLDLLRKGTTP